MNKIILTATIISISATYSFGSCNTTNASYAKSCRMMYSMYKKKYNLLKDYTKASGNKKISTCTKAGLKHVKELAREQAEEQCDYKVLDFTVDNTIGLACKNIYEEKRGFLFKTEYCKKHLFH